MGEVPLPLPASLVTSTIRYTFCRLEEDLALEGACRDKDRHLGGTESLGATSTGRLQSSMACRSL